MSPYNQRGNTAQMDEKAVKLVCAAALAGRYPAVVDEELVEAARKAPR